MDVSKWKRRRVTPTWGDNHTEPEPCVIVFAPPNVGWMGKWRELALAAPNLDSEKLQDKKYLSGITEWSGQIQTFRDDMVREMVLAVESLTLDGKAVSLDEGIEFILDNEGLREEVFLAIIAEGTLTKDAGKD